MGRSSRPGQAPARSEVLEIHAFAVAADASVIEAVLQFLRHIEIVLDAGFAEVAAVIFTLPLGVNFTALEIKFSKI